MRTSCLNICMVSSACCMIFTQFLCKRFSYQIIPTALHCVITKILTCKKWFVQPYLASISFRTRMDFYTLKCSSIRKQKKETQLFMARTRKQIMLQQSSQCLHPRVIENRNRRISNGQRNSPKAIIAILKFFILSKCPPFYSSKGFFVLKPKQSYHTCTTQQII